MPPKAKKKGKKKGKGKAKKDGEQNFLFYSEMDNDYIVQMEVSCRWKRCIKEHYRRLAASKNS